MAEKGTAYLCGHCGNQVYREAIAGTLLSAGYAAALRCPSCMEITAVSKDGRSFYPGPKFSGRPEHLPDDVKGAWDEACNSWSANALTAAEIMCRKILMHIAVDVAGAPSGKSFVEYVNLLESNGYITPGLKPAIDDIRLRGNQANHELPASTREQAERTMKLTLHLLRSVYEMPRI